METEEEKDYRIHLFKRRSPDDPIPGLLSIGVNCFEATEDMLLSANWLNQHIKDWQYLKFNQVEFFIYNVKCKKYGDLVHYVEINERSHGYQGYPCKQEEYRELEEFISRLIRERVTRSSYVPVRQNK